MNSQIDFNEITASVDNKFYLSCSIDDVTNKLKEIIIEQDKYKYKWLNEYKAIESLRLILSLCHKRNIDVNKYLEIKIKS